MTEYLLPLHGGAFAVDAPRETVAETALRQRLPLPLRFHLRSPAGG